jgi:hypothetical protein
MNILDRFTSKYVVNPETGCWDWIAGSWGGYGRFRYDGGNKAHRYSYEYHNDTKLGDLVIDHLCKNTLCVNPEHLEAVRFGENSRRRNLYEFDYNKIKKQVCKNGHLISDDPYVRPDGYIECRRCRLDRNNKL